MNCIRHRSSPDTLPLMGERCLYDSLVCDMPERKQIRWLPANLVDLSEVLINRGRWQTKRLRKPEPSSKGWIGGRGQVGRANFNLLRNYSPKYGKSPLRLAIRANFIKAWSNAAAKRPQTVWEWRIGNEAVLDI
ncbi:MAG: hypothetical protein HXX15_12890 [Rhodopseudomonas sp.]|uniref:hypothetical protein n=1 Tax=Rhodopseudomonas sp. TaxID=1078 RepID=UPI00183D5719|nr:hypothetical protein [Rhodopseudomonas sp.]NVN86969.1 hypothetical protein [Rhodopseudomonas sp.]